jgi:hypothetical protein
MAYVDVVLIYNKILEDHIHHIQQILKLLQKAGLPLKPQNYEFYKKTTKYLITLVIPKGLRMDSSKVSTVEQYPIL